MNDMKAASGERFPLSFRRGEKRPAVIRAILRGVFFCILCLILAASFSALAEDVPIQDTDTQEIPILTEQERRQRVVDYAKMVQEYTWYLDPEYGAILLYSLRTFPRMNGNRLVLEGTVYIAYGEVRGVPYSLAVYSDGEEVSFAEYQTLSQEQRGQIAEMYEYNERNKLSMKYGMSCATFVTECMREGFPEKDLPLLKSSADLLVDEQWQPYQTRGKHGMKDYPDLQPADFIYRPGHVCLVADNDPENQRLLVIEQSPPHDTVAHCENIVDEVLVIPYNDRVFEYPVKRVCMACDACRASTVGTQIKWYDYDDLRLQSYMAVFMDYGGGDQP